MTSGFFRGHILRGLAFRVLFFLSLALFPIGMIAISQTQQITEQNRINAELSLLAITEQASTAEQQILRDAFGASEALASIMSLHDQDTQQCSDFFRAYLEANTIYSMVGFIPPDGHMTCSSLGETHDFSHSPNFRKAIEQSLLRTQTFQIGEDQGRLLTVVSAPVMDGDELRGIIVISIPSEAFTGIREPKLAVDPIALMTFNRNGEIISAERGVQNVTPELPVDVALSAFTNRKSAVFRTKNEAGVERIYAVRPIVQNALFAVSVWPVDTPIMNPSIGSRLSTLIPVVMWAASLVVAFLALNRLAIRHIRKLGRQMRRFALNRNLPRETLGPSVPTELVEMEAAFINMGESILRDEATLEDSLREKNILLKEVHHRVKNNLQLISSIMNMQIRQARTTESSLVLRRLQERILSLATVHKNLYQNDDLARVDASVLLHEVVNQTLAVGLGSSSNVNVSQHYEAIGLEADDAAPLTLLVSEAMTNALKYVAQHTDARGEISVNLEWDGPERAKLTLFNTIGGSPEEEGTGLGMRLINAFARQLNGQIEVEETDTSYSMTISFPVSQTAKPVYDY